MSQIVNLELNNLNKLRKLDCSDNKLTGLNLNSCDNLIEVFCRNNHLTDLNALLVSLNSEQLKSLHLSNNSFTSDLTPLSKFVNLKNLWVSNNLFTGSLASLQNLTKLSGLTIHETNLDSGLEYLPNSLEYIHYLAWEKFNKSASKVKKLVEQLAPYSDHQINSKIKDWQRDNWELVWKVRSFSTEETKQWKEAGLKVNEYDFANYLKKVGYQPTTLNIEQTIKQESWQEIHQDFNYQLRKEWEEQGFNAEETKEWIVVGTEPKNYNFISWLRDTKKVDTEWVLNNKEEFEDLQKRYEYGLCKKCQQPNTGRRWCQVCDVQHSQKEFQQWTSGNSKVDEFICQQQLAATEEGKFLVWIPYEQLEEIEHIADGGFGKVHRAKWSKSNIHYPSYTKEVILKSLNNSQNMTADFFQEVANHKKLLSASGRGVINCYGISQNPETKDYVMVMQYIHEGNLRHYLQKKNSELSFESKLFSLFRIIDGLNDVHKQGLIHCDFHSGNVLNSGNFSYITDLGLTKPVSSETNDDNIYGVLPYVAPEVLKGQPYTQASDIYSFGIVAAELLTGLPPYPNRNYDTSLALDICQGLRPQFQIKIPQLLENLIKRCWNNDPSERPSASEFNKTLQDWRVEEIEKKDTEFTQQLQEAEEYNQTLPTEIRSPIYKLHSGAVMYSKLINTKQITGLLQNKLNNSLSSDTKQIDLEINFDLDELNITDDQVEQSEAKVEVPPKVNN